MQFYCLEMSFPISKYTAANNTVHMKLGQNKLIIIVFPFHVENVYFIVPIIRLRSAHEKWGRILSLVQLYTSMTYQYPL